MKNLNLVMSIVWLFLGVVYLVTWESPPVLISFLMALIISVSSLEKYIVLKSEEVNK